MKFEEVLPLLREGKSVRRSTWIHECDIPQGGIGTFKKRYMNYNSSTLSFELNIEGDPSQKSDCRALGLNEIMADDWEEFNPGF